MVSQVKLASLGFDSVWEVVSRGCKKRDVFGVPGGVVLGAPEGPLFGVLAGLGVPKGCFCGPTFVV